jgi:hypothetical protein
MEINATKLFYLFFGVVILLLLNSANANDNFVKIKLPKGVSFELPKNWVIISNDQRILLDTFVESGLDLAGIDSGTSDLSFAANYYKSGKAIGIINNRYYSDLELTQYDAQQATTQGIKEFDTALKESMVESLNAFGASILSWEGTNRTTINGITTFITEYHRKALNSTEVFRVRLVRVFAGNRSFTLTVSYNEEDAPFLKTITDRIISSLELTGENKGSAANSYQVSENATSNTGTVMSHMNNSGLQLFVKLGNLVSGLVFFYCLFSVPAQIIRRFRLKRQGKVVSPMLLIIKKLLKYWFFTALIFIPFSLVISYLALSEGDLDGGEIFATLVIQVFFGNIGTTLLFGYVLMKANKNRWSYSAQEEKASDPLDATA